MKVLIDTNVLLYAMDKSSAFNKISVEILENTNYELFVSTKNISELIAVCTKQNIDRQIILAYIEEIATLLYPNKQSFDKFLKIITENEIKGNAVYDMEIVAIAQTNAVNQIATFNHKDFRNINNITILPECL